MKPKIFSIDLYRNTPQSACISGSENKRNGTFHKERNVRVEDALPSQFWGKENVNQSTGGEEAGKDKDNFFSD